ncbi:amino acid ABC transporter permease [Pseudokineococcus marinus]|uniref:Amino acid ABC transporter permease n=1 Tax=Pseudokineococcus marinus TaxID=351215 RepID=A0A849BN46_9ACTN|nr:amino acid ABC transporter permease [Pseudokineococcus marinus]NNH22222.1 amino acid ABC transporter permease [Pseudokineococcus marinus]
MDAVLDNLGLFADGLAGTLTLFAWSAVGSTVLGTLLAVMRVAPSSAVRAFATTYVLGVRNTPLTVVFAFVVFGGPILGLAVGGDVELQYRVFAVIALTLYTSCFVCEALRGGIATVPVGQAEAARSLGLTFGQSLRHVVLPQAGRTVVPPLGSVLIAMAKNTSIAAAFGNRELISAMRTGIENRGDAVVAVLVATAIAYLLVTLGLSLVFSLVERKVAIAR